MKQTQLLQTLESVNFSGQITIASTAKQQWSFYVFQGLSIYATGGVHAVRRWRRNVALHCPRMAVHRVTWYFDLAKLPAHSFAFGWEYALLNLWLSRQSITFEQATKLIHAIAVEVIFEIMQAAEQTERLEQNDLISAQMHTVEFDRKLSFRPAEAIAEAQSRWQSWQTSGLAAYSPNTAPVIRQPDQLQKRSPLLYQNLNSLLNGQHTLYDLAAQLKRDVVEVAVSLLPCIQLGWVELLNVADFPTPLLRKDVSTLPSATPSTVPTLPPVAPSTVIKSLPPAPSPPVPALPPAAPSTVGKRALIACIDDSFVVRSMMEELLTAAGYQFVGISDPLRAMGILLAQKPDFIFLDLMMPNVNGHEVCQQIRRLSYFRNTPIVILTSSDGYVNRLQSSFVGASGFLAKPLDAKAVFSVIHKFLEQASNSVINSK